jgi:hypothetical protein
MARNQGIHRDVEGVDVKKNAVPALPKHVRLRDPLRTTRKTRTREPGQQDPQEDSVPDRLSEEGHESGV